jgi:hypothetical protein
VAAPIGARTDARRKAQSVGGVLAVDRRTFVGTPTVTVEEVFQLIEATRPDLLRELDEVPDVARREQWLDNLIGAKSPRVEASEIGSMVTVRRSANGSSLVTTSTALARSGTFASRPLARSCRYGRWCPFVQVFLSDCTFRGSVGGVTMDGGGHEVHGRTRAPTAWMNCYGSECEEEPDVRSTNARSRQHFCPEN